MTTKELITSISKATGLKSKDAKVIFNTIINSIGEGLEKGKTIELRGLGTFEVRQRKPKPARIIKTGKSINLPAFKVPYFKPGKILKKIVNRRV